MLQSAKYYATAFVIAALTSAGACAGTTITGAGATFPYPVYAAWAELYAAETENKINYQSIGSGGGIKQIKRKTVTFGASDAPLSGEALHTAGLVQWPMVMGGIVPVVNLSGISPGELVIDGPTLAKIFTGEVKQWDAPELKKLNPHTALPNRAIAVIHRSDGSGTTFNFTYYLSEISAEWRSDVGAATAIEWPVGIGAKGNEGVAGNVIRTKDSIGYVEYAYALQNDLTYTKMVNKDGAVISPTSETFAAAAAHANWNSVPGFGVILANQPGPDSWPMTAATFIVMHEEASDADASREALMFFDWAFRNGGDAAIALDYIPMPREVTELIRTEVWPRIKHDGASVYAN